MDSVGGARDMEATVNIGPIAGENNMGNLGGLFKDPRLSLQHQ